MQAVVATKYGPPEVLRLHNVGRPEPKAGEALVRIHAASLNAADAQAMRGSPFIVRLAGGGLFRPKRGVLGSDVAGRVEAVGSGATRFAPGDRVFGDLSESGRGGFAEYVCAPEGSLAAIPDGTTYEEAAAVPLAALTALQALRDAGRIRAGQRVLVNGASGGVGSFAVQIAKAFGAHVTALCSTRKIATVSALGADRVIDYTTVDFTTTGERYDLIYAPNGNHPLSAYRRALAPTGTAVFTGGTGPQLMQAMLFGPLVSKKGGQRITALVMKPRREDLEYLSELVAARTVRPVIDRVYPLSEAADAVRYLEAGHANGKVIITMNGVPE